VARVQRYIRNMNTLSQEENRSLKSFKVCVIGCGGLGGYVIEMLGRIGIGSITAVDYDEFDETNLNRQILANTTTLGRNKAMVSCERMKKVNPEITLYPVEEKLDNYNGDRIIWGHDLVVDALDDPGTKRLLGRLCSEQGIPLVHGAIGGWYGQVPTIFPGDETMELLYKDSNNPGIEKELGNPSFTPALVAAAQVAEAIKVLLKKEGILRNKILYVDLLNMDFDVVELK
jgi:molybdopterin/thiamine biosynthesis adenylyltransferase